MRHPHSRFTSNACPAAPRLHGTEGHHTSVQIITFIAMCYNSTITLNYNTVSKEFKETFSLR